MNNDIRLNVDLEDVKKIFGNKDNAIEFLRRTETKSVVKNKTSEEIYKIVVDEWNYDVAIKTIRNIAFEKKYNNDNYQSYSKNYTEVIEEIHRLFYNDTTWAFAPADYEGHLVRRIRSSKNIVSEASRYLVDVHKNYLLKAKMHLRSYLFEHHLIEYNKNILPTLSYEKECDFYVDGKRMDQKNSKSVTKEFKNDFGEKWLQVAKEQPELVAKYMYEQQQSQRFGYEPRIFIIEIDENTKSVGEIKNICREIDIKTPIPVEFKYKINDVENTYKTSAIVILI